MAKKAKISMAKSALIIVDVQNDFCPGGSLAVPFGDEVVVPLNDMTVYALDDWDNWDIFASRDWHPAVTNHFKDYGGMWPTHCVARTNGAEFHPNLFIAAAQVVSKGTEKDENAYSAFQGNFSSSETLEGYLKRVKIKALYIGGLATDYCVKETVLDALKLGFKVFLLEDAIRAVNIKPTDGADAIEEMKKAGAVITSVKEVLGR